MHALLPAFFTDLRLQPVGGNGTTCRILLHNLRVPKTTTTCSPSCSAGLLTLHDLNQFLQLVHLVTSFPGAWPLHAKIDRNDQKSPPGTLVAPRSLDHIRSQSPVQISFRGGPVLAKSILHNDMYVIYVCMCACMSESWICFLVARLFTSLKFLPIDSSAT